MSTENYLAIDTSSRYLTVLAKKGSKRTLRHIADCAMKHSTILMDEIDGALKEINLTPAECGFFAAVTGPGSFTGIRIGVACVKGFALATGKPLLGVTTFDEIAYNVEGDNFYTVIDAAHGCYYVKGYGACECEPRYISGETLQNLNFPKYGFELLNLKNYTRIPIENCLENAVAKRFDKGLDRDVSALYVRKSQAEEERK